MCAKQPVAVGLGEVLWDMLPPPAEKQLGGAPANFAYHAQQLGAKSAVVSAVGRDELGEEILRRLREAGLDTGYVAVLDDRPTGTVSVSLDPAGVATYVINQGVAWDFIPASTKLDELASRTDAVCFGSLAQRGASRETIHRFLRLTPARALRICDINFRQDYFDEDVIKRSLTLSNVLKLNDQELPTLITLLKLPKDGASAARTLIDQFELCLLAVTRGHQGSTLYTRDRVDQHPGYPAKIADTIGAGDAFTAAVAIGLLRGDPLERINDSANRLASYVCSQSGAMPPVPAAVIGGGK